MHLYICGVNIWLVFISLGLVDNKKPRWMSWLFVLKVFSDFFQHFRRNILGIHQQEAIQAI
jgi:hypothetical protein